MDGEDTGTEGFGREVQTLAAIFYGVDGFLASLRPYWLHEYLEILTGLFERVCLKTNKENMVGMVCQL